MTDNIKENTIGQGQSIDPISLLEDIRNYAENMTYHADQIAPRTVERTYDPNHEKYKKLLQYLSEK